VATGAPACHVVLHGQAGQRGKTTVAERISEILPPVGLMMRKRPSVHCHRATISSASTSDTTRPTENARDFSAGDAAGVLFIDEAYYLYRPGN